jgi:glycosyltransferase involved in cell wall biosynthesis
MKIGIYSTTIFPAKPDLEGYGGLELITGELAKYFDEHGHEVHLFAPLGSFQPKHGFLYSTAQPGTIDELNSWKIYEATPASKKVLLEVDILHDHSWNYFPYSLYNERNGRMCKTHHGPDPGFKGKPPYEKMNLIGVSQNHAKNLSAISGCTWRGVQNGIDLTRYPFKKEKQEYLLWVSRIFPPKGCHRFIDICDKLQMKGYILGGSFGQDPEYMNFINTKLANSKYITVVGKLGEAISFEKKVEMYQNAKAVVMPVIEQEGRYQFIEPFGLIAPEANACGTPMVVCPSGGWNESTLHGYSGFLANSDEEFIYYIKRILAGDIKSENCRKHAEWFSYERMGEEYLKLYKEILEGRGW